MDRSLKIPVSSTRPMVLSASLELSEEAPLLSDVSSLAALPLVGLSRPSMSDISIKRGRKVPAHKRTISKSVVMVKDLLLM